MISHEKVREKMKEIMIKENLTHQKFADSLGISQVMVSKVVSGGRNFSTANIHKMCEVWGVELESLFGEDRRVALNFGEILDDVMRIKKIDNHGLAQITGVDKLELSQIRRGRRKPTKVELQRICQALNVVFEMIDEETISLELRQIEESMTRLYLQDNLIHSVMKIIRKGLENRRYY